MIKSTRKDGLIPISEDENAILIRESAINRDVLAARFGPGGVALDPTKSPWALPILAKLRGITVEDGAGI